MAGDEGPGEVVGSIGHDYAPEDQLPIGLLGQASAGVRTGDPRYERRMQERKFSPGIAHLLAVAEAEGYDARRTTGRPTTCTPELLHQLALLLQNGAHPNDAAGLLGVAKETRCAWMRRGREALKKDADSQVIFALFVQTMEQRGAYARAAMGMTLHDLGLNGNVQAIQAWMKYHGVRAFISPESMSPDDGQSDAPMVIEFDGGRVFGGDGKQEAEEFVMTEEDVKAALVEDGDPTVKGLGE